MIQLFRRGYEFIGIGESEGPDATELRDSIVPLLFDNSEELGFKVLLAEGASSFGGIILVESSVSVSVFDSLFSIASFNFSVTGRMGSPFMTFLTSSRSRVSYSTKASANYQKQLVKKKELSYLFCDHILYVAQPLFP